MAPSVMPNAVMNLLRFISIMNIGILEILVILLIIVFIFGGNRLPDLGRGLGRGIRNFKEANRGTEENNRKNK